VYTDNSVSHRFIRFQLPPDSYEDLSLKVEAYINEMYEVEQGTLSHTLQED